MEEKKNRELKGSMNPFFILCGVVLCLFQVFVLGFYMIDPWKQQSIFMIVIFILGFWVYRGAKKTRRAGGIDILLMACGVAPCIYILLFHDDLLVTLGSTPETIDLIFGVGILAAVLELTRRSIGLPMFVVAVIFLLYGYFGNYLPGLLGHSGFSMERLIGFMYSTDGIFTTPLMVMTIYIYLFLLFGAFFESSGVGKFIIDLANAVAGGTRGGPAKVATWASCLFGMISGSAIANVMTTGAFTIPMMKKLGYSPTFAGAVEATASTGGQIMPPIMGAAAFILAEFVNLPYSQVMIAAFIPGFLYYACLFCQIDLRAVSQGLQGLPKKDLPKLWPTVKERGHLFLPIIILVLALVVIRTSTIRAVLYALASTLIVSFFRRDTRMGPEKIFQAMGQAAKSSISIAAPCAAAGIIIGVFGLTGLGLRLTSLLVYLAGDQHFVLMVFSALVALILGMGLPTSPAYIICAVIAAPALINLGFNPLAVHLFIFYFAVINCITPPVALAAFAAAGLAGSDPMRTGLAATRLGIVSYFVPFMFVYNPVLLMNGPAWQILHAFLTAFLGVAVLAMGIEGRFYAWKIKWNLFQRALFMSTFPLLLHPGLWTDLIGLAIVAATVFSHGGFRQRIMNRFSRTTYPSMDRP